VDTLNIELKPCPFCGHPAAITEIELGFETERMTITCLGCGVQLNHTQEFITRDVVDPISGEFLYSTRMTFNDSGIEIWNRRVDNG
jgi:hypothetical protein